MAGVVNYKGSTLRGGKVHNPLGERLNGLLAGLAIGERVHLHHAHGHHIARGRNRGRNMRLHRGPRREDETAQGWKFTGMEEERWIKAYKFAGQLGVQ